MTESEWLTCRTTPAAMLRHVRKSISHRRCALICLYACRRVEADLVEGALSLAWNTFKRYMETGLVEAVDEAVLDEAFNNLFADQYPHLRAANSACYAAMSAQPEGLNRCMEWVIEYSAIQFLAGNLHQSRQEARQLFCDAFREVVGNPFRPWQRLPNFLDGGLLQPDGRTVRLSESACAVAESIHAQQAYDRMPILADALEESGVTDSEMLLHCRESAAHFQGCWVIDLIRGKS